MKISLINIDSVLPNIALCKIEKFYTDQGHTVIWGEDITADKVFVSCLFTKNKYKCEKYINITENIGGTGFDKSKRLPSYIDEIKLKINYGYTTRGCIRNCKFCFVPKMEGSIRAIGDIYDIWDGKSKQITLLDNNILALPDHFSLIASQCIKEGLYVDFNQGLDVRLLHAENIALLKKIKHQSMYRFSWDNDSDMSERFKEVFKELKNCLVYVYVGPSHDCNDDWVWKRLHTLKEIGHRPYLMRDAMADKKWNNVARWVNQFWTFQKYTYTEFVKAEKDYYRKKKLLQ